MSRRRRSTNLSSRFIGYFAVTYLVLIGMMGLIVDRTARNALLDEVDDNLAVAGRLASRALPDDEAEYQQWAEATFESAGFRVTLIGTDGVVRADSHLDPDVMENHLDRPEVMAALNGEVGEAQRVSGSTGFEQRYVALPPQDDLIVRTSVPTRIVDDDLWQVRRSILVVAAVLGLFGLALVAWLARRLARPIAELTRQAQAVAEGEMGVSPRRSRVNEFDQLGLAIAQMADRLGNRVGAAEDANRVLHVVLSALPQATVLIDGDDKVVYTNSAAHEMLGSVPSTLASLAPLQLQDAVAGVRSSGDIVSREVDHGNPARRLRVVATPIPADQRVLLLIVDITESDRADSVRRDFVANASHELKTPISTIIASADALGIAIERGESSVIGFVTRIENAARQLDRLVTDLLDLSSLEREQPNKSPIRLDSLVQEEVVRIRDATIAANVDVGLAAQPVTVRANHRDIAVAVRNVLDNAIRYTAGGGSISVRVASTGGEAIVEVADTGEGIPMRDTERVFERFYRVDSARARTTGGTGLGLAIVKHALESHGGSVGLESELGAGTTVTLRLPMAGEGESSPAN